MKLFNNYKKSLLKLSLATFTGYTFISFIDFNSLRLFNSSILKCNIDKQLPINSNTDNIHNKNSFSDYKRNAVENTTIYIIIDTNNKIQEHQVGKFLDMFNKYSENFDDNKINIKIINKETNFMINNSSSKSSKSFNFESNKYNNKTSSDLGSLFVKQFNEDIIKKNINKIESLSDPIFLIQNNNSFLTELDFNKYVTKPIKFNQVLRNLTNTKIIENYEELRQEFSWLNKENSTIILTNSKSNFNSLQLLKSDKSKTIIIENEELSQYLKLENNVIYEYKPAKLPNKLKSSQLEKLLDNLSNSVEENVNVGELLNDYASSNQTSFMLRFNTFRNEYRLIPDQSLPIKNSLTYENLKSKIKSNENLSNDSDIIKNKIINTFFYINRNIVELAEVDQKKIENQLSKKDKHFLYIYVPNMSFLKEKIMEFILYGKI